MSEANSSFRGAFAVSALVLTMALTASCVVATPRANAAVVGSRAQASATSANPSGGGTSLEQAASKAGNTGRQVAMSLIGLAFAVAAIVLSFRRDFKEAAGVFAVGIVAVLLATPAGIALLRATVSSLFGSA
jgi:hypothetical protein